MSDGSVAVERKEQSDQNLEDEIEEEDEPELAIIEMEEQCDKEEGIYNENDVYSSLEDANRVRIEAPPHTFVDIRILMLWNELQEKIKNDSGSVETQGTVHYYQTLLKIVQYTEDIKRSAEVIFDNITSITEFHNDDKAQAIFKYSKKSFQRQSDRLCAFYNLPKERNSLSGEIELGGEEEIKEEGSMEMEVGLIEEEEEEEVKEEDNEQDNTLIQSNHSASVIETTDHNNVPSSSTSSISVVLNTPSHMDDITNTTQSLPQQTALLDVLTSPSHPHLPSNESSPSLHNSRPPSDPIPSSIPNQSIIAVTSPQPHSPLNVVAGPSTPLDTHLSPSRIELSSSTVPPSSIAPSSSQLPGSPPLKRVRVETDSSHSIKSTAPVQIRISPAKVSTPSSVGHPNTPATSRHPQSMLFPSDYAQNSAWFQQMMMSQGMSQFPPMSPHQMMHFHPGMKMQRKIGVPNQMPHQQTRASAPHISSQPGPSTHRQTNTTLSGPPSSQSTPPPIQKQMLNEMIQRIMCGQNPDSPMMSPPPQVNEHQPGRQMMMMPNGQQLSMHQMQQFQQQQNYQAMMAQQMQFMQQNRPQ